MSGAQQAAAAAAYNNPQLMAQYSMQQYAPGYVQQQAQGYPASPYMGPSMGYNYPYGYGVRLYICCLWDVCRCVCVFGGRGGVRACVHDLRCIDVHVCLRMRPWTYLSHQTDLTPRARYHHPAPTCAHFSHPVHVGWCGTTSAGHAGSPVACVGMVHACEELVKGGIICL